MIMFISCEVGYLSIQPEVLTDGTCANASQYRYDNEDS